MADFLQNTLDTLSEEKINADIVDDKDFSYLNIIELDLLILGNKESISN